MSKILIIGATSAIAQETAKLFAAHGDRLILVARNEEKLRVIATDLSVRGASKVEFFAVDLNNFDQHKTVVKRATELLGGLDTILIAHGTLGNQRACEQSFALAEQEFKTNFLSVVSLLTQIANQLEQQKHGCIVVISSVAGDRGRQSNYIYGTAKGAVNLFLQGLRNRLYKSGVSVITIKPGFVDTPMTAEIKKSSLFVSPNVIAKGIYKAIIKKNDVVYLPWFWWGFMMMIKLIPERIFKRMEL